MIPKKLSLATVLIANRSEIAARIRSTLAARGIKSIALYTKEDAHSSIVFQADESYLLPGSGGEGYLQEEAILEIALQSGAQAIHPGYGFLSESARFAQKVVDAGLIWIGPAPIHIALMGSKLEARKIMQQHGVPTSPGFEFKNATEGTLHHAATCAQRIGYPVILKSAQGGGGKAMRKIETEAEFEKCWSAVLREGANLFKSADIILEKYIEHGRHIEIQIVGDGKKFLHLFERECSIQRRHQKLIEETPCSFISQQTLEKMYAAALKAAQAIGYKSLGTVEFIVTADEQFYFLEMNTRLQVEHTVTEMTTGIDLVGLQLDIEELGYIPFNQEDIIRRGHAIQCRIIAENPAQKFSPSSGIITNIVFPNGPFLRHDHALEAGAEVSPFFDSMLSKLICYGSSRTDARTKLIDGLLCYSIEGIITNKSLLISILNHEDFIQGKIDTGWLMKHLTTLIEEPLDQEELAEIIAATIFLQATTQNLPQKHQSQSTWKEMRWQN